MMMDQILFLVEVLSMEIFILYTMIIFMDHYINYHMTVSSRVSFSVTLIPSKDFTGHI